MADVATVQLREKYKDLALAAVFLVIGIGAFLAVNPNNEVIDPGPGGMTFKSFPFVCAAVLMGLTFLYAVGIARDIVALRKIAPSRSAVNPQIADDGGPTPRAIALRRVVTLAILLGYVAALQFFGFEYVTPVFLFLMFFVFGETKPVVNLIVSIIGSIGFVALFIYFLNMPL